jgi:hypothetical protein
MPARSDIRWLATARIAFSADLLTAGVSVISLSDASLINLFDGASRFRFPTRCRDRGKRKRKFGRTQPIKRCVVRSGHQGPVLAVLAMLATKRRLRVAPRGCALPDLPWCRYADDGLVHCRSETKAQTVREALAAPLTECRLELHPTKTKFVYCKDHRRRDKYETVSFDFLGYCFRPRSVKGAALTEAVLRVHP